MIIDSQNEYSDSQAVTASAASTNVIDHGVGDAGIGDPCMYLVIQVDESVTAAGAATVQFTLETDDDSAFGSASTLLQTAAIGKATLTAGHRVGAWEIPSGCKRYSRVSYTVGTGPLTAGKFSAYLTPNVDNAPAYARGYEI